MNKIVPDPPSQNTRHRITAILQQANADLLQSHGNCTWGASGRAGSLLAGLLTRVQLPPIRLAATGASSHAAIGVTP
ncbi:hypothetical protein AB3464_16215 [Pseudomonas asplenii]|uniref:hypothetical protein n=1 Tax=Pseudomonas asplenii TaxID=53407 RepID=UPI0037C76540